MKRALCLLTVVCILFSSLAVLGENPVITETPSQVSNKALGLIRKIEDTIPREIAALTDDPGEMTVEVYAKYSRFLFYVEELEALVSRQGDYLTTEKDSLESYQKFRTTISPKLSGFTKAQDSSSYVLKTVASDIETLISTVLNSDGTGASRYKASFSEIRNKMKMWGDFIYFMRSDMGMEDEAYRAEVARYDEVFSGLQRVNQITGEDLNLGLSRPQDVFSESMVVSDSVTDENGDLHQWFVEVLSLTAKIRAGEKMDDYTHLLTPGANEMYEKYKSNRVPLYKSIDKEPMKNLLKDSTVTLTQSNLQDFIESINDEMVLYLPRGEKLVGKTTPRASENTEEDDAQGDNFVGSTVTDDNVMNADSKFIPVYAKTPKTIKGADNYSDDVAGLEGMILSQSSALMNHMQLVNYYESGHLNDFTTDLGNPLFIDLFGNITTYTGIVVIPAVSNVTYMAGSSYMPFNAFFMNNYPKESSGKSVDLLNLFTADPAKYVITLKDYGYVADFDGSLIEQDTEGIENSKDLMIFEKSSYELAKFKKGKLSGSDKIGFMDNNFNSKLLPNLVLYIETEDGKQPFMKVTEMNKDALTEMNRYSIVGLKDQVIISDEGKRIPFTFIDERIPVEQWVFHHYWGESGDSRRLKNTLFNEISQTVLNTDIDFDIIKVSNAIAKSKGFKLGSILEPIHKMISESATNYILHTPSIAELPGMDRYASTFMIPIITILLLVALLFAILDAIRSPNIEWTKLIVTIIVIFGTNWLVTNFYPAMLNVGFNGSISRIMGSKTDLLALYNVEKDLNSKGEFVYTENPSKIISEGGSIKIGELEKEEAKRIRKAEEGAPWKDSIYYHPKWDPGEMLIGNNVFVKGDTLNVYVKDLFSSANVIHDGTKYNLEWYNFPDYSYYIPYLNILEGLTQTLNMYSDGEVTPKKIRYSNGFTGTTGTALMYFGSEFFLVDEATAYAMGKEDPGFLEGWKAVNNSDFLNLQSVMRMEENEELSIKPKFEFPFETEFRTKTTRWYKTAVNGRKEKDVARKIKNINLSTRQYAMNLLPYMDNITDDVILKSIALHATKEFSKEFSHNPLEKTKLTKDYIMGAVSKRGGQEYYTGLYPKNIDMSTVTFDEHMKLSFVNMYDLLKFHITALYPYLETKATWFGMLLFSIISIMLFIKSLMRITFISVIVIIGLIYMILVYAIRREYSNKTVFGVLQIIMVSWFVYLVDNLLFLAFINFDKSSPGVLFLLMMIWLLWNITSIAVYMQLFMYFFKDIKAFGGNIFLENANAVLEGVTRMAKAVTRPFSETTAENIDYTNPNWEMKQDEFEEYLNKDVDVKMQGVKDQTHDMIATGTGMVKDSIYDRIDQVPTLRSEYHRGVEQGLSGTDKYAIQAIVLPQGVKDYLDYNGVEVEDGMWGNQMTASMDTWNKIVEDSEIKTESFGMYKEGKDGNLYMTPTELSRDLLNRTGVGYTDLNQAFAIRGTEINKVEDFAKAIKSPLYKVNAEKREALKVVESKLSPNAYEIGDNSIYLKNEKDANELYPNETELTYQTMFNIVDREDKLRSGGFINKSMDVVNGSLVTSEYVYGAVSKEVQRSLLSEDIRLMGIGKERFKFNRENREQVLEAVSNSAKYTDNDEGILFRDKVILDKFIVRKGSEGKTIEEGEIPKPNYNQPSIEGKESEVIDVEEENNDKEDDNEEPHITMELD